MYLVGVAAVLVATLLCPTEVQAARGCGSPSRSDSVARLPVGHGEISGFVASRRHPGVGWMIRDSGHPPSLYALHFGSGGGPWSREFRVAGADNRDWEDMSYSVGPDGRGRLWIVESTQSGRDPFIYEVLEPDPDKGKVAKLVRRYRFRYPDRGFTNTEASFFYNGDLIVVTKTAPARLYRFGGLSDRWVNRPRFVGELRGADRVSVARPSPDHSTLVTSDHDTVTVFRGPAPGSPLAAFTYEAPAKRKMVAPGDNIEAGDYFPSGSCDVLMLSERRNVYRLRD
ncbi:MAG: hypothetical protein ACRDZ7_06305 [Acidimicrobiia bacterium]